MIFIGPKESVNALIRAGAIIHHTNRDGISPLINAAMGGHLDILTILIDKGADANEADNNGFSPLIWASVTGNI